MSNGDAPPTPTPSTNGHATPQKVRVTDQLLNRMIANAVSMRQDWLSRRRGAGGDPRRDIADECGYNQAPGIEDYRNLIEREPVADKANAFWANETWQVSPTVYEDEDADTTTPFETAWDALGRELAGDEGLFYSEDGSPVWEYLRRVDILSGMGHYGVLLLGLDDGLPLSEPAAGIEEANTYPAGKDKKTGQAFGTPYQPSMNRRYQLTVNAKRTEGRRLLYLRAFAQGRADIVAYETNFTSPRYRMPTMYRVTLGSDVPASGYALTTSHTVDVHWSRAIHVADTWHAAGGDECLAIPRLLPVLDPVEDIRKVRASSAEMYYKGAFPGFSLELLPGVAGAGEDAPEVDVDSLRDIIERYINGLQRYAIWENATMKSLAPQVVDPTTQIEVQERMICAKLDIPWRIWQGSERGELASSQDQKRHNRNVSGRQNRYATPRLVRPFVGRLVSVGVLPRPAQLFCEWPEIASMTELEKAQVSLTRTQTMAAYVSGNVGSVIAPVDQLTRVMDYSEEEAAVILENATAHHDEELQKEMDDQQAQIDAGLALSPVEEAEAKAAAKDGAPVGNVDAGQDPDPEPDMPTAPPPLTSGPHREVMEITRDDDGEMVRVIKDFLPLPSEGASQ